MGITPGSKKIHIYICLHQRDKQLEMHKVTIIQYIYYIASYIVLEDIYTTQNIYRDVTLAAKDKSGKRKKVSRDVLWLYVTTYLCVLYIISLLPVCISW